MTPLTARELLLLLRLHTYKRPARIRLYDPDIRRYRRMVALGLLDGADDGDSVVVYPNKHGRRRIREACKGAT